MHGLVVVFYLPALYAIFNKPFGAIGIAAGNGNAYGFNTQPVAIQRGWAKLNAHSGQ